VATAVLTALVLAPDSPATAASTPTSPIAVCAYGTSVPDLEGYLQPAVSQAAAAYGASLPSASRAEGTKAFAAATAAYVFGLPQVTERQTIKGFIRNEIISVDGLANASTHAVVSPNVDTAYSVSWIDLTTGPVVITVPNEGSRFYTFQIMDAYTNAYAYIGTGSTGTAAGAYAILPPGWSGTLPAGVHEIKSPTNTDWLLGRTLVENAADLPAVKKVEEKYTITPLEAWAEGVREPSLILNQAPTGKKKTLPTGAQFIATLNQELTIDPPPAADDCALHAMAPAGVELAHPSAQQSFEADVENIAGATPPSKTDATRAAAVKAGTAAAVKIIAGAANHLITVADAQNHGWTLVGNWIARFGTRYLGRAIIATDFLGANTNAQALYPTTFTDVDGLVFNGAHDYTLTFPKGELPPAKAFWSLTMYQPDDFLYANSLNRYALGNRSALHFANDGSLTLYIQHKAPTNPAELANWLPAPAGGFHLTLRIYQPARSALIGAWRPPPVIAEGEVFAPILYGLKLDHGRLSYRDTQATRTEFSLYRLVPARGRKLVTRFAHKDRAGLNRTSIPGKLRPGTYRLSVQAQPTGYDSGPSVPLTVRFRIR